VKWKQFFLAFACALAFLGVDGALKAYVHSCIAPAAASDPIYPYGGIAVFREWQGIDFCLVHVINRGAAWGLFASIQDYLLYARVAIIGGLITYLLFVKASLYRKWSLLLVSVGALGNVLDTFIYGHVLDMFCFTFWGYAYPVFNLADSAIFVGISMLLFETLIGKIRSKAPKRSKSS
jgi:signal peptidase II